MFFQKEKVGPQAHPYSPYGPGPVPGLPGLSRLPHPAAHQTYTGMLVTNISISSKTIFKPIFWIDENMVAPF